MSFPHAVGFQKSEDLNLVLDGDAVYQIPEGSDRVFVDTVNEGSAAAALVHLPHPGVMSRRMVTVTFRVKATKNLSVKGIFIDGHNTVALDAAGEGAAFVSDGNHHYLVHGSAAATTV